MYQYINYSNRINANLIMNHDNLDIASNLTSLLHYSIAGNNHDEHLITGEVHGRNKREDKMMKVDEEDKIDGEIIKQSDNSSRNPRSQFRTSRVTGTVGDRLLARMKRNVLQDITLPKKNTRNGPEPSINGTPENLIFPGGYISQEESIRRSHQLKQTKAPLSNKKLKDGSKERRGSVAVYDTNVKKNEERSNIPMKLIKFRYDSDTLDSDDENTDHTSVGFYPPKFLGPDSIKKRDLSLSPEIEVYVRSDSGMLVRSDSEINCTDTTESLTSAQWLEAMTATSSRTMKSGLSQHMNFRTLRTEVSSYSAMTEHTRRINP